MTTIPTGGALATDYFLLRDQFTDEEWDRFLATRRFVDEEVLPTINEYWEAAELPWPLFRRLAELGLFAPMNPLAAGLVHWSSTAATAASGRSTASSSGWR